MQNPDHLSSEFFKEVSDLLVAAMSMEFSRACEEGRTYRVTSDLVKLPRITIGFERSEFGTRYITFHFDGGETLVLSFDYVPNATVTVERYDLPEGDKPQPADVLLNLLNAGLKYIQAES